MAGSALTANHAKYTNGFRPIHFRVFGVVRGRNARPGSVSAMAAAAISAATVPAAVKPAMAAMMSAVKPAMAAMMSAVKATAIMMVVGMVPVWLTAGIAITAAAPKPKVVRRTVVVRWMG